MRQAFSFVLSFAIAITILLPTQVRGQTPESSPGLLGTIVTIPLDALPGPNTEVWFLRFNVASGAALPESEQAGPSVFVLESGELAITSDLGVTTYSRAGEASSVNAGTTQLSAGADTFALLAPDHARLTIRNEGAASASVLVLLLMSAEREVEVMQTEEAAAVTRNPETGASNDVTTQGLAMGRAEFGTGPGTITLERIAIDPGAASTIAASATVQAGTIESGEVDYSVTAGSGYIWPGIASGTEQVLNPVELKAAMSGRMTADDGYFFGVETAASITATGGTAVILRAIVTEQVVATPNP